MPLTEPEELRVLFHEKENMQVQKLETTQIDSRFYEIMGHMIHVQYFSVHNKIYICLCKNVFFVNDSTL